ncbi:hypothetical protein [Chelativorans salis]|uniref:Uncharacterized protein n=1 Tax=Chelativorans salis TaxID=2978478 RepID=A0ABT2LIV5_9HYPH|nr:hypothetical protein [Chelativorans sp. EGI FJ00035]MCT7374512.1 hypothetical protein [Chelativorans sp. EGI FJ00035]
MVENPDEKGSAPLGGLSEELASAVRDRVRDARHVVRRLASGSARDVAVSRQSLTAGPRELLREVARISDTALTQAETIAVSFAPPPLRPHREESGLLDPRLHFAPGGLRGAALFKRDMYRLTKGILAALGLADPLIHESRLGDARHALERGSARLVAAARNGDEQAACQLAARLALELARREPVILALTGGPSRRKAEIVDFSYAIIGLAVAVAWTNAGASAQAELIDGTVTAALARQEELESAMAAEDAEERLAAVYAKLAPHLP